MNHTKRIAVFCGSSLGIDPLYKVAGIELARLLINLEIGLVYGGGNIGLMGILADEMLRRNGEVIGVIPQKLVDLEVVHSGLSELHVVDTMHERKAKMMELSDAFVIMPGGIGTLDEFFDVLTWRQLGYHEKKISILNINGYFDPLVSLMGNIISNGFVYQSVIDEIIVSDSPSVLLEALLS